MVSENIDACCFLECRGEFSFGVVAEGTGSVGDDEKTSARVRGPQSFKPFLGKSAMVSKYIDRAVMGYLVWPMNFVGIWNRKAIVFIQDNCLDLDLVTVSLQSRVDGHRQISKGWHYGVRKAY